MQLLNGEKGPFRDVVKLNAICSILASGLTNDIKEASEMVTKSIDSKSAFEKLNLLKQISILKMKTLSDIIEYKKEEVNIKKKAFIFNSNK